MDYIKKDGTVFRPAKNYIQYTSTQYYVWVLLKPERDPWKNHSDWGRIKNKPL